MKKISTWAFLSIFSAALTGGLASVGGSPLRSLHRSAGARIYWLLNLLFAVGIFFAGWPVLAISFAGVFMTVGFFTELEDTGLSMAWASLGALGLIGIVTSAVFAFWIGSNPGVWVDQLIQLIGPLHAQVMELRPELEMTKEALLCQLPGIAMIGLMASIFFSLAAEKFFGKRFGLSFDSSRKLTQFKLPDELIWALMLGLLAAFYQHGLVWLKYVGVNLFMICFGAYFFQGLAVATHFFNKIKLGPAMKVLAYFVLVFQLVLFVSMIGIADMWIDFRAKKKDNRTDEKFKTENY